MEKEKVREWSLGYLLDHWTRVVAIVVLIFTGFYIHWPFIAGGPESFIMAWMRFFHFVAAYALILGLVVRVYMAFRSTFDSDWKDFGIIQNIKNVPDILSYYLFINKSHKDYRKYNPLQALAYLFLGVVIVFSALTGLAVYHGNLFGFIPAPDSFRWVSTMLGGESYTRIWHILTMWVFIIFVLVHVYLSLMASLVNKDNTFTSIFTGFKLKKH
ncbi:MAG: Ni/Fe-hydrogenase, b-type cytochrome subunit [Deltaproteobacteria bacterium]|nr:Ni/Fe-hydrogenase, b-type cytochrome subunit [Deltaproteobacteria bacterium]